LSSCISRPITCGPVDVDVAVGATAAELFDFLSVPCPRGWWQGHWQEWLLLPPCPFLVGQCRQQGQQRWSHHCRGDAGEDKERTESFDHRASATRKQKVHLLVAVGHGGQWWWGFWSLTAREGIAPSTTASSAITSTPATSRATMTATREGAGHYNYPMQQCSRSEEFSPKVDKKIFFQLGISNISPFLQPKNIFDPQEGISDQKDQKSLPEVEKNQLIGNLWYSIHRNRAQSQQICLIFVPKIRIICKCLCEHIILGTKLCFLLALSTLVGGSSG
jgi:hypothetical protein